MADVKEFWATGRRKSAVARIKAIPGNGHFRINKRSLEEYFSIFFSQILRFDDISFGLFEKNISNSVPSAFVY